MEKSRTRTEFRPCIKCKVRTKTRNYLYVYCKKCTPPPFDNEEHEMAYREVEAFLEKAVQDELKLPWEKNSK